MKRLYFNIEQFSLYNALLGRVYLILFVATAREKFATGCCYKDPLKKYFVKCVSPEICSCKVYFKYFKRYKKAIQSQEVVSGDNVLLLHALQLFVYDTIFTGKCHVLLFPFGKI